VPVEHVLQSDCGKRTEIDHSGENPGWRGVQHIGNATIPLLTEPDSGSIAPARRIGGAVLP